MKSSTLLMLALSMSALCEPIAVARGQAMRRTPLPRGDTAMIRSAAVATRLPPAAPFRQVEGPPAASGRRRLVSGIVGGVIGGAIGFVGSGIVVFSYSCVNTPGLGGSSCETSQRRMNVVMPVVLIGGTAAGAAFGSWIGRHLKD